VSGVWLLASILLAGLVIRLFFIGNDGFKNDVSSFEGWAMTLGEHPFSQFYAKAGFVDYPPGYFYILGIVGGIWELFFKHVDTSFGILKVLVKLPAILADLLVGVLLYRIVRRFADERWALGAAAFYLLNPAIILISAMWGQVDAISGGLALLALFLLLRSEERPGRTMLYVGGAWLTLAYSLLIKPQTAALLVPLFIAFAFVKPDLRNVRVRATLAGIGLGVVLAIGLSIPFHPTWNPIEALNWLLGRYLHGASQYAFTSVNAFNLWSIKQPFWQRDDLATLGLAEFWWGLGLLAAATVLVVWRYVQVRTSQALFESAAVLMIAFFMLATRMHERYLFDGLLFAIACLPFAWRYIVGATILSITLWANLDYSLAYLANADKPAPFVSAVDLWGPLDHVLSFLNVATFFVLGYQFLGGTETSALSSPGAVAKPFALAGQRETPSATRGWFDPREGLIGLRGWVDYAVAAGLGIASFVLSYVSYWIPGAKMFDEIYFARAGEEYLKHLYIYENTHPPLAKLLIAGSMLLFGGLHGAGDTAVGWRFLDVVFGALVVVLLFFFAKRVTGSTIFAAIAASFLMFDGMHYVQSRIATPEGFVVFFSLAAVYALYRFWIASQANVRKHAGEVEFAGIAIAAAIAMVVGFGGSFLIAHGAVHQGIPATLFAGVYCAIGIYLALRLWVLPHFLGGNDEEISYAEGSYAIREGDGRLVLHAADGGMLDSSIKTPIRGALSQSKGGALVYEGTELEIVYARDASVTYRTPAGEATYVPGDIITDGVTRQRGRDARLWLVVFALALGCLVASKWYGVMGFGVSFTLLILIWLQRFVTGRPTLWGNPRGFRLDVALLSVLFISGTVYSAVWIPDAVRHISGEIQSLDDVIARQQSMFSYHYNLHATHPYSSKWFEWPIDYVPVAYFYEDHRTGKDKNDPTKCCVEQISSMPNPFNMWLGLLTVPFVGFLAWKQRHKGYALIVLTYLFQWLPWAKSPRLAWEYHFYVDIPLICLCNAIALQWLWHQAKDIDDPASASTYRWLARAGIGVTVLAIAGAFVFFFPILSAQPITYDAWHARMWFPTWVIGPG
jgi:Gpi18-like mannosyltransferase